MGVGLRHGGGWGGGAGGFERDVDEEGFGWHGLLGIFLPPSN